MHCPVASCHDTDNEKPTNQFTRKYDRFLKQFLSFGSHYISTWDARQCGTILHWTHGGTRYYKQCMSPHRVHKGLNHNTMKNLPPWSFISLTMCCPLVTICFQMEVPATSHPHSDRRLDTHTSLELYPIKAQGPLHLFCILLAT